MSAQLERSVRPIPSFRTFHETSSSVPDWAVAGTVTSSTFRSAYGMYITSSGAAGEATLFDSESFSKTTWPSSATTKTVKRPLRLAGANIVSVRL